MVLPSLVQFKSVIHNPLSPVYVVSARHFRSARPANGPAGAVIGSATRMLCTPLVLDTHATRPPAGAATSSVGNGVAIKVSIDRVDVCCADNGARRPSTTNGRAAQVAVRICGRY